jgi:glycosyltransferase involved in cell wall biosynthesis
MEEHAATIAVEAARSGWEVTFAAPDVEPLQSLFERLRDNGVSHLRVPPAARRKQDHVAAVLGFLVALARTRPHVVQLELPWPRFAPGQLLSCALLAVPTVVVFQLVPADVESLRREIAPRGWLFRAAQRRQTWVAVSEYARATVARLFDVPVQTIERIYNGVDLEKCDATPGGSRDAVRASLGFGAAETMILSAGRLAEQKCFADLLTAFARVASRRPDARLVIAGEGPERPRLEELLRSLELGDRARLLGNVDELPELYGAADLFVLPSSYEGFPFALLEAMAAGLPVVATRFGGADELVEDGVDGRLAPVADAGGLAAAIEDVLADSERMASMAASAGSKARRFSKARMVEETLAVLDRTASS